MEAGSLSQDAFLGGKLQIWQPREGYRAGTDPVFLAASVRALAGQSVLEMGCGVGVASLCLGRRVAGLSLTGIELQSEYSALAQRNSRENQVPMEVIEADLDSLPLELRQRSFDHVIANPPYFETKRLTPPKDSGKEISHIAQPGSIANWVETGVKRLSPKGVISIVHLTESLTDVLGILSEKCGEIEIFPIVSRGNRPASRVITTARKGSRTPLVLHPPKVVHKESAHTSDAEDYSDWATGVLRYGEALQ